MTTPEPFRLTDGKGGWLEVRRVTFIGGGLPVVATGGQGFAVDPLEIPEITRAMYTAAGMVPPVMLGRPEADQDGALQRVDSILVGCLDGKVTVALYGIQPEAFEPARARHLAALIAANADVAEAWPSGAEIDELAAAIAEASGALLPSARLTARKILLAGWKREAGHA